MQTAEDIKTEFLATWDMVLSAPEMVGAGPHGTRMVIRVLEGRIEGPHFRGQTLASTSDALLIRHDGVAELNVRSSMKTDDGEAVYMEYRGIMHGTPEVMQAGFAGKPIAPSDLYFRMAAFFETASPRYEWLNKILAVGNGVVALPKLSASLFVVR
jgi:hypothetical protein